MICNAYPRDAKCNSWSSDNAQLEFSLCLANPTTSLVVRHDEWRIQNNTKDCDFEAKQFCMVGFILN